MGGRAVVRVAGGNRRPWGVTCHGTRAKAHAGTHPSAHPLAQLVDTAGQPLGAAGVDCYCQCPNPVLSMQDLILKGFLKKTSESNSDDAGQPVWDLGFVRVSVGVCSSHPADQRHWSSESCALSPSARGGASPSLSCQRGGGPRPRPRGPQESASTSPSAGATLWYPHPPISLFPRSQGFSDLNATGRPRGSRRLSGAAQRRAGGRTHPGRSPAARLGGLEGYALRPATILAVHRETTGAMRL